ncbi:MAG: glycosyltransferase family 2 protein [Candidatus Omnitrophica bacterium]|nr:glycosyltransferase family 2 protein [Candidatus Omnitrophota bacterium]
MSSRVTIVVPTYNRVNLLAEALKSCLAQTHEDLEVIVVDDASTDTTESFVRGLSDPRVIYVKKPRQTGSVASINMGFARASGDYLTWSSDDDLYAPGAIKRLVKALEENRSIDFFYAHYAMIDLEGKILYPARVEDPEGLDRDNYVGHCFLYRRKVYEVVGDYHAEPVLAEEYEYWLRVRAKFKMKRIPELLYYHRIHPQSITVKAGESRVQEAVAQARRPFIPRWKHYFYRGELFYHNGRRWKAAGCILVSIVLCPLKKAAWRILAKLILQNNKAK